MSGMLTQEVKDKLSRWYSSTSTNFPDGTKMRLVPTINSLTSMNNRTKFASCIARQAALNAGLASAVTREITTNLLLDRKDQPTKKSFRQVLMEISPKGKGKPGAKLFHTIDRQFKSDVIVNFQFHPEYASEANNLIAGLVPFLRDTGNAFHLKMFTPEALQRQAKSKWNPETREADSETDAELANLLAEDDDLNFTDEPTPEKASKVDEEYQDPVVSMEIPPFSTEHIPSMRVDEDSISTFHPGNTVNLTDDLSENDDEIISSTEKPTSPVSILRTKTTQEQDAISKISISDSESRISSLETELSTLNKNFHLELSKLQTQAVKQADAQNVQAALLTEIIDMLKRANLNPNINSEDFTISKQSESANHPQTSDAGGSLGVAGHG